MFWLSELTLTLGIVFVLYGNGAVSGFTMQEFMCLAIRQGSPFYVPVVDNGDADLREALALEATNTFEDIGHFQAISVFVAFWGCDQA